MGDSERDSEKQGPAPEAPPNRGEEIEGRPFGDWLVELLAEDRKVRLGACRALDRHRSTVPEELSVEEHWRRSDAAIRCAVDAPGFPRPRFLEGLVLAFESSARANSKASLAQDRQHEALLDTVDWQAVADPDTSPEQLKSLLTPVAESITAPLRVKIEPSFELYCACSTVFDALDSALLEVSGLLRRRLSGQLSHAVAQWLQRVGPSARDFLPEVLAKVDAGEISGSPWTEALAAIVGEDVSSMALLAERLDGHGLDLPPEPLEEGQGRAPTHWETRLRGTLGTFTRIGAAARPVPGLLGRLEELIEGGGGYWAIEAFGAVGADDPAALDLLIGLSASDRPWHQQAAAIVGLAHFPSHARRVVPVLVERLSTFEEEDPDFRHAGEHERLLASLAPYGRAALPAIDVLREQGLFETAAHRGEGQKSFALFLANLGPAAAASALADLERLLLALYEGDRNALEEDLAEADRDWDWLLWALLALRGEIITP